MRRDSFYRLFNREAKNPNPKLPSNRVAAYFDIFRNRFFSLVCLSMLTSIFALPLLLFVFLYMPYSQSAISVCEEAGGDLPSLILMLGLILSAGVLVLSLPMFYGLAGLFFVMKGLIYQEGSLFYRDFFQGMKSNAKEAALSWAISAITVSLFIADLSIYPSMDNVPSALKIVVAVLMALIVLCAQFMAIHLLCYGSIYDFKLSDSLRNCGLFAVVLYPLNLAFLVIGGIFFILLFIPFFLVQMICLSICVLFGFAHFALVNSLYCYSRYDKYINSRYEEDLVGKGLDKEEK